MVPLNSACWELDLIYNMPYFQSKWPQRPQKSCDVYCAAINCHNTWRNCKLSMFEFLKDVERCRKCIQNSRWDDLRTFPIQKLCYYQLCSKHFEDSQFMNKETKNKLIWNAIPTLFDVLNPPSKITPSWTIKPRSMMSTMKKLLWRVLNNLLMSYKISLQLQSKAKSVTHHRKRDWSERHRQWEQTLEKMAIHKAKKQSCNWFIALH